MNGKILLKIRGKPWGIKPSGGIKILEKFIWNAASADRADHR